MNTYIELELTLMNGDLYYLYDCRFTVMQHKGSGGCSVNGYAVLEAYEWVVDMIRERMQESVQ
jgi:hypothetical protein